MRRAAMDLLARREHSAKELKGKLARHSANDSELAEVLEQLQQEGLQSDQRFAESYTRMRVEKGYGPLRIRQELTARGVSAEIINASLDHPDEYWRDCLSMVYSKKYSKPSSLTARERAKRVRFLMQRGFLSEQIHSHLGSDQYCGVE